MKQIEESSRTIPVMAETDVLVVGSGPSGMSAALASAREGVETMLVERYGSFGGNITQAMIGSISWYRYEHTVEAGGIGVEFETKAKTMGGSKSIRYGELLDPDMFKYVADKMVLEADIVPVLHCLIVNTVMDGNTIKGVITESKSGRQAILAKRVIDCSGDADVAFHAGAPYHKAPKKDQLGVTVNFGCSGIDGGRFVQYALEHSQTMGEWAKESTGKDAELISTFLTAPFDRAKEAGEIPKDIYLGCYWSPPNAAGEIKSLNATYMLGLDATDVWDLTEGELVGRQHAIWAVEALRKYAPGFEKATLRTFSSSLGTRESRKIIGAYNITEHDVKNQGRFHDSIGIFPEFLDAYDVVVMPTTGRYFQIPYGIILPQKVENLLVAGRSVAGDRMSHAATREMMCCAVTGQGAGVAAASSLKDKVKCSEVNISKVQQRLKQQGVRID
ncbi:MAG: FAD-dependent oxidoreductase [Anaerolineales bacterium]|nr:FAD-dependent oxidoreductase [Anaerolineales bacterium]